MKLSFVPLSLALLSVPLPPASLAFAQQQRVDVTQLEKVTLEELKETNTPGAAVAAVSGDRLVFAKAFGAANIETGGNSPKLTISPNGSARESQTSQPFAAGFSITAKSF